MHNAPMAVGLEGFHISEVIAALLRSAIENVAISTHITVGEGHSCSVNWFLTWGTLKGIDMLMWNACYGSICFLVPIATTLHNGSVFWTLQPI